MALGFNQEMRVANHVFLLKKTGAGSLCTRKNLILLGSYTALDATAAAAVPSVQASPALSGEYIAVKITHAGYITCMFRLLAHRTLLQQAKKHGSQRATRKPPLSPAKSTNI